jgi:hypothetical protein
MISGFLGYYMPPFGIGWLVIEDNTLDSTTLPRILSRFSGEIQKRITTD